MSDNQGVCVIWVCFYMHVPHRKIHIKVLFKVYTDTCMLIKMLKCQKHQWFPSKRFHWYYNHVDFLTANNHYQARTEQLLVNEPSAIKILNFIFYFQMLCAVQIVSWGHGERKKILMVGSDTCLRYHMFASWPDSRYLNNEQIHKWGCCFRVCLREQRKWFIRNNISRLVTCILFVISRMDIKG